MFQLRLIRPVVVLFALLGTCAVSAADASRPRLAVGDAAPAYAGRQLDGTELQLAPAAGKAYVISFWASWCAPCLAELPVLSNIQRIAGPQKMQVIAINIEERDVYRKLERHVVDLGVTAAYDPGRKARDAYGVDGIPHMIIVGRDGLISSIRVGYEKSTLQELATDLNQALSAPAQSARRN